MKKTEDEGAIRELAKLRALNQDLRIRVCELQELATSQRRIRRLEADLAEADKYLGEAKESLKQSREKVKELRDAAVRWEERWRTDSGLLVRAREEIIELRKQIDDLVKENTRLSAMGAGITWAAVSIIVSQSGKLLCVWNKRYNAWSLPGGLVEVGESLEQAQARELLEETGVRWLTRDLIYKGPNDLVGPTVRCTHTAVYLVRDWQGPPRESEPGCPVKWLTRDEFLASTPFAKFYRDVVLPKLAEKFPEFTAENEPAESAPAGFQIPPGAAPDHLEYKGVSLLGSCHCAVEGVSDNGEFASAGCTRAAGHESGDHEFLGKYSSHGTHLGGKRILIADGKVKIIE